MQNPIVKQLLALVAGVIVGGVVVAIVEGTGHTVFPPPDGVDLTDPAALASIMDQIPLGAKLFVVLAWLLGSLAGGFAAAWTAGRLGAPAALRLALIAGAIFLAFGVSTLVTIPHPLWMAVLAVVIPIPAAWAGGRLAGAA